MVLYIYKQLQYFRKELKVFSIKEKKKKFLLILIGLEYNIWTLGTIFNNNSILFVPLLYKSSSS